MITVLVFVGSILALVGIHELGHFLAARLFGVYVIEFALGFGPKLISLPGRETRYSIRLLPLGGYVKMAGEDRQFENDSIPESRLLYRKPPYVRALISLAGPLSNLLLALAVILAVVWTMNWPILQVADVIPDTPAAVSLAPGDRILSMDEARIYNTDQITSAVQRSAGEPIDILLLRGGQQEALLIRPAYVEEENRYVLGAYFQAVAYTSTLTEMPVDSLMASAGLQAGDRIVAVDGVAVNTAVGLLVELEGDADPTTVTVDRSGTLEQIDFLSAAALVEELVSLVPFEDLGVDYHRPGLIDGLRLGAVQFAGYIRMLADVVRGIISGQVAAGDAFQGPVGIARLLGEGLRLGASVFFQFLAFLSLNFGLLNLIPFPALDGSRAVFALYEWARGKPIPPQREGIIHAIGFVILLVLMFLILSKDLIRLLG